MSAQELLMFKAIVLISLGLFFFACASPEPSKIRANQKTFEEEDLYILYALYAQESSDYGSASTLFETLYKKSNKKEYLYHSLENEFLAKNYENAVKKINTLTASLQEDTKLVRFKIIALFELNRLEEAEELSVKLVKETDSMEDYLLVSDVLIKRKKYDLALNYLQSAYTKEYNEKILDKISLILYMHLNRKNDAISYLESHSRVHGASELIGARLLGYYSDQNDIDGLLRTYKKLYAIDKSPQSAEKIVQIYTYKRDYMRLIAFLEESKSNDELLLQLYSSVKNYEKAHLLAESLYKSNADLNYLGQSAIYEYESAKNKNDTKLLRSVVDKLQKVVDNNTNPTYLNYLGYLLIDHNLDVKKGMQYIREVLKIEPNSAYYLDSLAWGHYRLGECKKAQSIIKKAQKLEGGDHPEVLEHVRKIEECLKNSKKGKL